MASITSKGILNLAVVYVIWGSTYLAIRIAVREGAGFPPFALAASRVLAAASILFVWTVLRRGRLRPSRGELVVLAGSGVLMWVGGNGLVTWAETRADSGLAALIVGIMPIWAVLIESIIDRRVPSKKLMVSLLLGFAGVALLFRPVLREGIGGDLPSLVALVLAPLWWALGSIWLQRRPTKLGILAISAWQQFFGGLAFLVLMFAFREPLPTPTGEAWLAWIYLVVFGSVLAFSSYMVVLRLLPVQIGMTYAYANPVIAVFLGWMILSEQVTLWTFGGAAFVVLGIAGVLNNTLEKQRALSDV
jgi:drug/metabolite transporter (DMT)-like permease